MNRQAALKPAIEKAFLLVAVASLALAAPNLRGQQNLTPAAPESVGANAAAAIPAYDVVSIKEFKPDGGPMMVWAKEDPDGMTATHFSLKSLICNAYGVSFFQITGLPSWADNDLYDVKAKMDESTMEQVRNLTPEQAKPIRQRMLQAVLADRFKLTVHHATKQLPVYALEVAKGGPRMHEATPGDTYPNGIKGLDGKGGHGMMSMSWDASGTALMTAQGVPMDQLAAQLGADLHSKVENRTDLKGSYDFTLRYGHGDGPTAAPGPSAAGDASISDSSSLSILEAVRELGLKLTSTKGEVDVLVIDHVERPSEN